jgi:H+/Cl- antiporter ClcA
VGVARVLIVVGIIFVVTGLIWLAFPKALSWFGKLPGDINIQNGNTRIFIPVVSMLLVSVALTLVVNVVAWLLRQFR